VNIVPFIYTLSNFKKMIIDKTYQFQLQGPSLLDCLTLGDGTDSIWYIGNYLPISAAQHLLEQRLNYTVVEAYNFAYLNKGVNLFNYLHGAKLVRHLAQKCPVLFRITSGSTNLWTENGFNHACICCFLLLSHSWSIFLCLIYEQPLRHYCRSWITVTLFVSAIYKCSLVLACRW